MNHVQEKWKYFCNLEEMHFISDLVLAASVSTLINAILYEIFTSNKNVFYEKWKLLLLEILKLLGMVLVKTSTKT